MKVQDLKIESAANGTTCVKFWCECHSADDVDDIVAWLELAKTVMVEWERIREQHRAKTSNAPQAATGKYEDQKQRQV